MPPVVPPSRRALIAAAACIAWSGWPAVARAQPAVEAPAAPVTVGGVRFEPAATLGGARLALNGAGIRWKIVRVYAAGLYLAAPADTPEEVLAQAAPRRLHIVMLRDIDANELGKLFTKGMQDNAGRDEFVKSIPGTVRMGELFAQKKRLAAGESFSVDWVPGIGTQVVINGKPAGEPIREPEFQTALMKIWLGPRPADAQLKDALLGIVRKAPGQE